MPLTPANFRGPRCLQNAGPNAPKSEARLVVALGDPGQNAKRSYLTGEDIAYCRDRGFKFECENDFITIDFLQICDGYMQILDYKHDARKEKHVHVQLTIYALALARRANLPLKNFKCAWFDEKDYFERLKRQGEMSCHPLACRLDASMCDYEWGAERAVPARR